MIYTCYEMIQDCRADQPAGWRYFVDHYVPLVRHLLAHYFPERSADEQLIGRVLQALRRPDTSLFQSLQPVPERAFVAELRQHLLGAVAADRPGTPPDIALDLPTLGQALAPLTMVETQAVWMETMRYDAAACARILHIDAKTVQQKRARAAELIRGKVDAWRRNLLEENGAALGRAAAEAATGDCCAAKTFLDAIDGRITWRDKEQMEAHAARCLHCVDHFCRLLEAADWLRVARPLAGDEAAAYYRLLGVEAPKVSFWKKMFAR